MNQFDKGKKEFFTFTVIKNLIKAVTYQINF